MPQFPALALLSDYELAHTFLELLDYVFRATLSYFER
jgi:hypothetical protein